MQIECDSTVGEEKIQKLFLGKQILNVIEVCRESLENISKCSEEIETLKAPFLPLGS